MPHVERDGVKIFYEVAGDGEPLLLSHGYSATSRMWEPQVEAFAERYRVITWDMRGHGQSDCPEDDAAYSQATTVDDMAAILDQCAVERAFVGGLSLGGFMSLAFHYKYPERVRALLLFDTGPGYKNDEAREEWNRNALARARDLESEGFAALSHSREVRAQHHRSAKGLARAARGMLTQRDDRIIRSLPEIEVPTLVLVGSEDTSFLAATDYMAQKIPGARKAVVPGAGHASNLDRPEAFNHTVLEFLVSVAQSE